MARARVLIVEDERQTVDELRDHLELHGYETEVALTVPVSVSIVEERMMDLAIIGEDVHEVSGLDILNKLKELAPGLKILMMTAQKSKRYQASLVRSGAQGVLTQPLDKLESLKLIKGVLKRPEVRVKKRKRVKVKVKKKVRVRAKAKKRSKVKKR
ncbi:MAG: response regulator [Candidatus Brocadiales bacterium]